MKSEDSGWGNWCSIGTHAAFVTGGLQHAVRIDVIAGVTEVDKRELLNDTFEVKAIENPSNCINPVVENEEWVRGVMTR